MAAAACLQIRSRWTVTVLGLLLAILASPTAFPQTRNFDDAWKAALAYKRAQDFLAAMDLDNALANARQALALQERAHGPDDPSLAEYHILVGQILREQKNLDGALEATRRALQLVDGAQDPDRLRVAGVAANLAAVLYERGDLEGALDLQRRALKILEESLGPNDPDAIRALASLGTMLNSKGAYREALKVTEEALRRDTKVSGADHINVVRRLRNLGMIRLRLGELDTALQETQRALYMSERLLEPNHVETASILSTLGWILKEKGNLESALLNAERALEMDQSTYGVDHPWVAQRSYQIAAILREKKNLAGALAAVQRALRIDERSEGIEYARDSHTLAQILLDKGDLDRALAACQRALSIDETRSGPNHPSFARDSDTLAAIFLAQGNTDAALRHARRALEITEKISGPDIPLVAFYASRVGQVLQARGDLQGAQSHFERAHRILLKTYGPDNPATRKVEADLQAVVKASWMKMLPAGVALLAALAVLAGLLARRRILARRAARAAATVAYTPATGSSFSRAANALARLGPYRLEERLGAGGMGVVYRAYDERLDRSVAVKVIPPDHSEDPQRRERLRREARASARLSHPAIIQVYDFVQTDEVDAIVMELVEGEPLSELLRRGPLDLDRGLTIAREVTEALAEAHSKGIVHRDLKTENVFVTLSGHAKVLDFGIAKRLDGGDASLTMEGAVLGTYRSMAPEQAQGHEVDHRADLFALGTLLYEIFTGESPFAAPNGAATLRKICWHQQPPAHEVNPRVPADLSDLIDRLLQKEPHHRPQDTREVAVLLARMAAGTASSSDSQTKPDSGGGTTIGFFKRQ
jgi:tetratricopeptide (TPR) repeat protein